MKVRDIELLTAKELAERLKSSRATVSRLVAKGVIGYYRIGLRTMFSEEHLSEYLQGVECAKSDTQCK